MKIYLVNTPHVIYLALNAMELRNRRSKIPRLIATPAKRKVCVLHVKLIQKTFGAWVILLELTFC